MLADLVAPGADSDVCRTLPLTAGEAVTEAEWDAYVASHPDGTIDHAWRWQQIFLDVFGHKSTYVAAKRGDRIVGVLPLVTFNSRLFGRFIFEAGQCPRGGRLKLRRLHGTEECRQELDVFILRGPAASDDAK